jgi:hypothetical protein
MQISPLYAAVVALMEVQKMPADMATQVIY